MNYKEHTFIMKRKNIALKALTCGIAALAMTACTDTWDNHYEPKTELNATETLWDLIEADPQLTQFEEFVKATGYDELLKQNRFYTIWAPVDGSEYYNTHKVADINGNDSLLEVYKFEFVENHIADYNHTASGNMTDNLVKMINGKYNRFDGAAGNYTFKEAVVTSDYNIAAKNGLLHKVQGNAIFTANIWEYLAKEDSLSLLNDFLKSYDEIIFDEMNSVAGPTVGGQVTYLDSVVIEYNPWFERIGQLNREDSSYTMFAPTNKAWREIYEKAQTYFVYDNTVADRDSLQATMAKDFMCRHLVFSNKLQESPQDSMVSFCYTNMTGYARMQREVFKGDALDKLYSNLQESIELSNGTLNIVNSYNYRTFWHDTLRVEGESLLGQTEGVNDPEYKQAIKSYVTISRDSVEKYKQLSNGSVGVYKPTTATGNPTLTFTVNNVLSAKYRIKVVLVPTNFVNPRDTVFLPNKFNASLYYRGENGKKSRALSLGKNIVNDPYKVDTITLVPDNAAEGVDYFEFPVNEFNLSSSSEKYTQIEIKGSVKARGEEGYDRTLRIDQVFLEPVTE